MDLVQLYVEMVLKLEYNSAMMVISMAMIIVLLYVRSKIVPKVVHVADILCRMQMDHVLQHVEMEFLLVWNNVMMEIQIVMMDARRFVKYKIVRKVVHVVVILCLI